MTSEQIKTLESMLIEARRNERQEQDESVARLFRQDAEAIQAAIEMGRKQLERKG